MKLSRVLRREEEAPPALPAEPKARDKGPLTPLRLCDVCMVIGRGGLRHGQAGAMGVGAELSATRAVRASHVRSSSPLHGHQHLLRRPVPQRDQLPTLPWP